MYAGSHGGWVGKEDQDLVGLEKGIQNRCGGPKKGSVGAHGVGCVLDSAWCGFTGATQQGRAELSSDPYGVQDRQWDEL